MSSKTIIRWTIGDVSRQGFDCLKKSVSKMIEMYGTSDFEYFVCYNGIPESKIQIRERNVVLLKQEAFCDSLPIPPHGPSWKLYPPRIDILKNEIFIDNDIVLHKKIDLNERQDFCFISEAVRKCYGALDAHVVSPLNMNSGFFRVPAGFDLGSKLSYVIHEFNVDWRKSHFEEQGAVAYLVSNSPHFMVGLDKIKITWQNPSSFVGEYGTHFIGLNGGQDFYWKRYRNIFY